MNPQRESANFASCYRQPCNVEPPRKLADTHDHDLEFDYSLTSLGYPKSIPFGDRDDGKSLAEDTPLKSYIFGNDVYYQQRIEFMELSQAHLHSRINHLIILLSHKEAENEDMREYIHGLTNEKLQLVSQLERLEIHNANLYREYKHQELHLWDLYHSMHSHGFNHAAPADVRKAAPFDDPEGDVLPPGQNRHWSLYPVQDHSIHNYSHSSDNAFITDTGQIRTDQGRSSSTQSSDKLIRRLANLKQKRDHIDGYIQWLKQEAGKTEHIYDDPFGTDPKQTDDEFEHTDGTRKYSHPGPGYEDRQRSVSTPSRHGVPQKLTHPQDGISDCAEYDSRKFSLGDKPNLAATNANAFQLQPGADSETMAVSNTQDRRSSLAAVRARFMRKDSLLGILFDSGGVSSKSRKSVFSTHKPKHNAFITGRVYSAQHSEFSGSPTPTRRIRTHIL